VKTGIVRILAEKILPVQEQDKTLTHRRGAEIHYLSSK